MITSRTMRLVVNGKSSGDPALRTAVAALREKGASLEVRVTWEGGDAARYAAEAVDAGLDVVIAGGGDGTINEVVNGMMAVTETPKTALGIIPYGTANDFATGCGAAKGDPLAALNLAAEGRIRNIDVGKINDRYFINVASGGFGARVTAETPTTVKKALGGVAYSLMGLVMAAKMTPYQGRLILPDREEHGSMILMAIGNGRLAGGGYQVTPRAILNDGLLDAMAVVDVDVQDLGLLFSELSNIGDEANQYIVYKQMKTFRIEADQPIHMNLDGEPILETTFDFDVLPQNLPAVLPEAAPLANLPAA